MSDHTNDKLAIAARLNEIGKAIVSREEEIEAHLRHYHDNAATLANLAFEQGKDIMQARAALGNALSITEWLESHCPNVPIDRAKKYERVAKESLDPNQMLFLWFDRERKQLGERTKPAVWERSWGYIGKLRKQLDVEPFDKWPADQQALARSELLPVVKAMFPNGI